jgi:formate dehydrogenase assembly factor FdhD
MRTFLAVRGAPAADIVLSTGRISVCPLVAFRISPTDMAIELAARLHVSVCGHLRPDGLNLCTGDALMLDRAPAPVTPARSAS